jgi:hypothetical protein
MTNDIPLSNVTFDPFEVWPEEPQCFYQPCDDKLVLILLTQKQQTNGDWSQARFFCAEHGKTILVHSTSKLPSGHIVGIVKEPDWETYDARDADS